MRLFDVARKQGISEGELLAKLPDEAFPVRSIPELIAAIARWGRVRVVVRNRLAVAELLVDLAAAIRDDARDTLTLTGADLEAHLALGQAAGAYFVVREGHGRGLSRSVAFVDDRGDVFAQIFLLKTRNDADYRAEQLERYERDRARLTR